MTEAAAAHLVLGFGLREWQRDLDHHLTGLSVRLIICLLAVAPGLGLREWSATVAFTGTSAVEYKYVVCKADHVRWEVRLAPSTA